MAAEYRIRVIYHQQDDKMMRAIQFFQARPTLLGHPLTPGCVILVDAKTLEEKRTEIEPFLNGKLISIVDRKGVPFAYYQDPTFSLGLMSEESLELEVRTAIERAVEHDLSGLAAQPAVSDGPLEIPPELPPSAGVAGVINTNDEFFRHVKDTVVKRRKSPKKRTTEAAKE